MTLMKDCPEDAALTRKELIVAARHLWYTEFRNSFVKHIDLLLNDDVFIGSGVTCRETLKPLGRSVSIDFLYNVRSQLTLPQISKIIFMFARDLEDPSFPTQIQTMCVKLLIGLCDNLVNQGLKNEAREYAVQILEVFSLRLCSLKDTFETVLKYRNRSKGEDISLHQKFSDLQTLESFIDIGYVQPIRTSLKPLESAVDLVKGIFKINRHEVSIQICSYRN
jgi:transformation/transcription domain-associated protein